MLGVDIGVIEVTDIRVIGGIDIGDIGGINIGDIDIKVIDVDPMEDCGNMLKLGV